MIPQSTQWEAPYLLYHYVWEYPSENKGLSKWDFCSDAWVMPQVWDLRALGCPGGKKNVLEHVHVAYQIDGVDK